MGINFLAEMPENTKRRRYARDNFQPVCDKLLDRCVDQHVVPLLSNAR